MNEVTATKILQKWVDKPDDIPLEDCHNERKFLAPCVTNSDFAEITINTLNCWGQEAVDAVCELKIALGTEDLWISYEQDKIAKTTKVKAEAVRSIDPIIGNS